VHRCVAREFRGIDCFLQRAIAGVGDSLLRGCDLNRGLGVGKLSGTKREQRERCKDDPVSSLSQKTSYPALMRASEYGLLHVQFSRQGMNFLGGACGGLYGVETLSVSAECKLVAVSLSKRVREMSPSFSSCRYEQRVAADNARSVTLSPRSITLSRCS